MYYIYINIYNNWGEREGMIHPYITYLKVFFKVLLKCLE